MSELGLTMGGNLRLGLLRLIDTLPLKSQK